MDTIVFINTPCQIISDANYSIVNEAAKFAIDVQYRQQVLTGAPVATPSVCQLPCGTSLKIDQQTRDAVSVYSGFYSSIGDIMILIPRNIGS
jgi:hypothetical protein